MTMPCSSNGQLIPSVERKSVPDPISSLTNGRLRYALAALPRAAVVAEDRLSQIYKQGSIQPAALADRLASARSGGPTSRSCSARPGAWPKNGPTGTSRPTHAWAAGEADAIRRTGHAAPRPSRTEITSEPKPAAIRARAPRSRDRRARPRPHPSGRPAGLRNRWPRVITHPLSGRTLVVQRRALERSACIRGRRGGLSRRSERFSRRSRTARPGLGWPGIDHFGATGSPLGRCLRD